MTTPETETTPVEEEPMDGVSEEIGNEEIEKDERKRRLLLLLLLLLLLCLCCVGFFFARYLLKPQPLPQMVPPAVTGSQCYAPLYKSAINDLDSPLGVAVSPDDQRVYITEGTGERLIKVFDRNGNLIKAFSAPGTDWANRSPTYIAVNSRGQVFVVDRTSNAIEVYDADGNFIDAIIGQDLTLSKVLSQNKISKDAVIASYDPRNLIILYQLPGQDYQHITFKLSALAWSPIGIRFDKNDNLIYTDASAEQHSVHIIPASAFTDMVNFSPKIAQFGSQGKETSQFDFPQVAVMDSRGNYYISDGNNSRITSWTPDMKYRSFFGFGAADGSLNLPRGAWMDPRDCLLVADTVGAKIQVYDVSEDEPKFAYSIGEFGIGEGLFSYPNDVIIDGTGRLYVTDRENNRVQIWSY